MAVTPPSVNGSDPSIQRQVERQTAATLARVEGPINVGAGTTTPSPTVGRVRSTAPIISGSEVIYPQSTAGTSIDSVTITSSANNEAGDVTTVYSTNGQITVNPINQTINQYTTVDSGVAQIIAGDNITITSTAGDGTGIVTINSTGGGNGNYSNSNVASYLPTYTGNVGAGNVNVTGTVYANGISSTGLASLTTLNVGATANLGAVGNVKITGGSAGQKLTTDGAGNLSWTNDANSSYGNSNVVSLMAAFGSNTITTTGNVSVGNIIGNGQALTNIAGANVSGFVPNANVANTAFAVAAANVSGLGNIATLNLTGSTSNVLYGNGTFAAVPAPTVAQDITSNGAMSIMTYDGNLKYVNYATVEPSSGNIAGGNISANGNISGGNISATGNITANNLGNISSINIDGSNSNVLYGNGVFAAVAGGNANTGNVTFDDNIVIGTGDEFGGDGLFLAPGNGSIANSAVQYLRVRGGDFPTHIHLDTGNNEYYDQYFGADSRYLKLEANGNVVINADDYAANSGTWTFTTDGNLILADGNSVIQSIANSSLDPTLPNVSTMTLTPDQNYNSQALVLDPTAPGHIHLRAYAFSNIDDPAANIFLGGEDTAFEVTSGANNQAVIHSNGKAWTFGNDGNISSDTLTFTTTFANVKTVEYQTAGVWDLYVEDGITGSNTASSRLNVSFKDNLIDKPQVYIENTKESDGIALRWTFDENGNLNFPRDVAGNSDPYLNIFGGSTPTIQSTDVSLAGPANLAIQSDYLNLSGSTGNKIILQADAGAIATDAAMVLSTNLADPGNIVSWTLDTTGNLTLPDTSSVIANVSITLEANDSGNITGLSVIGDANANLYAHGNVTIVSDSSNTTATWAFGNNGILTLPGGSQISETANTSVNITANANTWAFGVDGNLTVPGSLINDTSIVLAAPAVFNICTIATAGSGYNTGSSLKATTGGSGSGMTVGIGYGLSNQLTSVNVVDPGTGYVNGDVITVSEGTGGTFVISKYNQSANQTNNNTIQTDFTFANSTVTLPIYGEMATDYSMTLTTNLANAGNTSSWTFGTDGNLTVPGNLVIAGNTSVFGTDSALIQTTDNLPLIALSSGANGAVSSIWVEDVANVGTSNIAAVYANPTVGSGIVRIAVGQNGNAGPNLWDFGTDGNLTIPSTSGGFIKTASNASIGIAAMDNGTNNPAQLLSINVGNGNATSIVSAYSTNVAIQTNASGNINTWAFDNAGNLTLPANTFAIKYANGTQVSLSGSNIANGNSNVSIATANGNITISAVGNTTMTVTGTGANVTGTLTSTGKIGYASGSTVTQTTGRGNGVTINAIAGTIITTSAAMVANEIDTFSVINSSVDPNNDIVLAQIVSPNQGTYNCIANPAVIGGFSDGFYINIVNISGFTTANETITIRFMVIKAPNA